MDLLLDERQALAQSATRQFLAADFSFERARRAEESLDGFDAELWSRVTSEGWNAASLAAAAGGSGRGLADLCAVAEELGRSAASTPLVASSGLAATLLHSVPSSPLVDQLLTKLSTQGAVITAALVEEAGRDERTPPKLVVNRTSGGITVSGVKLLVPYASAADVFLVSLSDGQGELVIGAVDGAAAGVTAMRHRTTGGDPLFRVQFDGVEVPEERILARGAAATAALDAGLDAAAVVAMAEAIGYCEGIIDLTTEHAKSREQFGRLIGSFQAVSHPLADMRIRTDACRLLMLEAAWLIDQGSLATLEVASAKAFTNEAVARTAIDGHRLHGAIGYSNECDLQLLTRRARAFCLAYGGTDEQLERAANALGL